MKRAHAIAYIRIAGYHNDTEAFTRLYVENRLSMTVARQAFANGALQRKAGVRCECHECKGGAK